MHARACMCANNAANKARVTARCARLAMHAYAREHAEDCTVDTQTPCARESVLSTVAWAGTGTGNLRPRGSALRSSEANALREWQPVLGVDPWTVYRGRRDSERCHHCQCQRIHRSHEYMIREVRAYRTRVDGRPPCCFVVSQQLELPCVAYAVRIRNPESGYRDAMRHEARTEYCVLERPIFIIHYSLIKAERAPLSPCERKRTST